MNSGEAKDLLSPDIECMLSLSLPFMISTLRVLKMGEEKREKGTGKRNGKEGEKNQTLNPRP